MDALTENVILQLGISAAVIYFVYMLIKELFSFLIPVLKGQKSVNGNSSNHTEIEKWMRQVEQTLLDLEREVHDLYVWHNVRNPDGVFVWYVRSSLEEALSGLSTNLATQTQVLRDLAEMTRASCKALERVEKRLEDK